MRWLLLLVTAMLLAGCEAPPKDAGTPVCGRFSIGIEKPRLHAGEDDGLHVRIENCGTADLAIGITPHCQRNALFANVTISGQAYDITSGAAQRVPAAAIPCAANAGTLEMLSPGHVRDQRLIWNGTLDGGAPAPAGTYVIASAFTTSEDANKTYQAQLTIEVI